LRRREAPKSFWVPAGTPFLGLVALAGSATVKDFGIFVTALSAGLRSAAAQGHAQPRIHHHGRRSCAAHAASVRCYACPEDLYPKNACDQEKQDSRAAGLKFVQMKEYRRMPLLQFRRLQVDEYERETPYEKVKAKPAAVRINVRGHAGQAAGRCWRRQEGEARPGGGARPGSQAGSARARQHRR
jgi:hypothetical protein